jgi:purine-binding chemotaxis protein CheW
MKSALSGLQQRSPLATASAELLQFAALQIGSETYALDIMRIKGIINPVRITPVPKAPPFIEGVIELRGSILPVVDMRKRFDLPVTPSQRSTKYVLVGISGMIVGLVVDSVTEVIRVSKSEIRPAPALAVQDAARYFSGVCHHHNRIIMVVDLDAILSSSEKVSLAGMGGPAPAAAAAGPGNPSSPPGHGGGA